MLVIFYNLLNITGGGLKSHHPFDALLPSTSCSQCSSSLLRIHFCLSRFLIISNKIKSDEFKLKMDLLEKSSLRTDGNTERLCLEIISLSQGQLQQAVQLTSRLRGWALLEVFRERRSVEKDVTDYVTSRNMSLTLRDPWVELMEFWSVWTAVAEYVYHTFKTSSSGREYPTG